MVGARKATHIRPDLGRNHFGGLAGHPRNGIQQAHCLLQNGYSSLGSAHHDSGPARRPSAHVLTAYKSYLIGRWREGDTICVLLWREIQALVRPLHPNRLSLHHPAATRERGGTHTRAARLAVYPSAGTVPPRGGVHRYFGQQQVGWPPTRIADTPEEALARLFLLPGAQYTDPLLSWKFEVAPAGLGFVGGQGLGPEQAGDLIVDASQTFLLGGQLWRLELTEDRQEFVFSERRLDDWVAHNLNKYDLTESESLLFGQDFGIATDIQTGPNGHLATRCRETRSRPVSMRSR
jgi:hypothetical protein